MGRQDREQSARVAVRNAWTDLAAARRDPSVPLGCVRPDDPEHRATDTRLPATEDLPPGPWNCGVCHPPPPAVAAIAETKPPPAP